MHFEWDFRGRTYWLDFGFSGTKVFAWRWRHEDQKIPDAMYRCHPGSLTVFDRSLSELRG